jgi:hypothetical protein
MQIGLQVKKIIFFFVFSRKDFHIFEGNLCWSMPCMNGGSCFGSTYTYLCVCPVNYSGALCEKRLGRNEYVEDNLYFRVN